MFNNSIRIEIYPTNISKTAAAAAVAVRSVKRKASINFSFPLSAISGNRGTDSSEISFQAPTPSVSTKYEFYESANNITSKNRCAHNIRRPSRVRERERGRKSAAKVMEISLTFITPREY